MGARPLPADPLSRLHLAEHGPPDAPPVLLLHGWPQTGHEWRRVVARLAPELRVLVPDLRSSGRSPVAGDEEPATFAADAIALLDALGIERAVIGGHDWGGFAALLLALEHPERVVRVVATGTPHPWPRLTPRAARELWRTWYALALASPLGPPLVRSGALPRWMLRARGAAPLFAPEDVRAYLAPLREPARAAASQRLYRAYVRLSLEILRTRPWEGRRLAVPARLLFGTQDAFVPLAYVDGPEGPAHGLEVELLPGVSHWVPEERPELVAARLAGR